MPSSPSSSVSTPSLVGTDSFPSRTSYVSKEKEKDDVTVCEKGGSTLNCSKSDHESATKDLEQVDVPDGGLRAWLVVAGVWITQFCSFGYTNAYGVYNDYYVRTYLVDKYTSAQISWIGSVQLFLVLSIGLFTGRAFDTGHFYHLMIGGSVLLVFCLFMISITQPLFILQGVGIGAAIGMMYIPAVGICSHYFRKRRPFAIGIATSGSALGGALHPIMLNHWFHGPLGFRNGVRLSAGLNGGLLLISLFLMKPRLAPTKESKIGTIDSFKLFLKDVPYVFTIAGTVFTLAGLYYPIFFVQLNSIKNGINPTLAFYTIAILNGASSIGRIIPNLFVYRYGVFNVLVPCVATASVLVFCTLAVKDAAGTLIFAILYGFFSGACIGGLLGM
ncbi:hypothetical protein EST38_g4991 [Candolleomyces aberdarensis]|uniref:MFS general substrate transporter n=1 Tax=Candolleomyces aberdarensis TaxID=2316362 RepID=A0A4Q2DLM3_9AGAR|nr:hypothetical protein EST38_g4991 [Candolleomyces aberdarensis]